MRSNRFKTFLFLVALLDFPKLVCLDIVINLRYLIFGIKALAAVSPSRAFACSLYPFGRLSERDPVFSDKQLRRLRGDVALRSFCLLMRTMFFNILHLN